CLQYDEFRTF
nr:immunoglobulin light chain junction region [Mus musculus]NSL97076.1 immunoglobulin light chain junction region [Mus musculus]NSL97091.1 immunoglobulin light chain junction region [Mus musculus]NSL97128.1 immunoglobulin light chain junction region [Mus musculus]NSL97213.1 immunoglobulin light chain junction region [Mus musculus]